MTDLQLDPKRTALLLMDLQPAVIDSVGVDEDLIARAEADEPMFVLLSRDRLALPSIPEACPS